MYVLELLTMAMSTIFITMIWMLFHDDTRAFAFYFIAFGLGVFTILCIRDFFVYLKELKHKAFLEKLFIKMAKEHCKSKYNKNIDPFKVKVNYYQDFIAKEYINSGTIFFNKEKKLFVKISLDSNFSSARVTDNLIKSRKDGLDERLRRIANGTSNNNLT